MNKYDEHEKVQKKTPYIQAVKFFLDWCRDNKIILMRDEEEMDHGEMMRIFCDIDLTRIHIEYEAMSPNERLQHGYPEHSPEWFLDSMLQKP